MESFGAAMILIPFAFFAKKHEPGFKIFTKGSILGGLFLGIHFSSWCWAIQHTTIANATLFIALQPLMVPFIAHWMIDERINCWELLGLLLALIGTIWLSWGQLKFTPDQLSGTFVAIISAFFCAVYIVIGRKFRRSEDAISFSAAIFTVAAMVQAFFALILNGGFSVPNSKTALALAALILFPTIGGHAMMIYLLKYARSQLIAFNIPAQFVLASLVAIPIFGEKPALWFYPGAVMIISGVAVALAKSENSKTPISKK